MNGPSEQRHEEPASAVPIRGRCPKCNAPLTVDELRVSPTVCPGCKTELQVLLKANWAYPVVSYTIGVVVAYLQGYESIILGILALFYGTVIFGSITIYRWALHLPIKVVEKPDYRLFPKDTS
jgi:hypothetical protein